MMKVPHLRDRVQKCVKPRKSKVSGFPSPSFSRILCLEDKIVQQAVVTVLEAIYEEDFLGFSYGFRPGRGQHDALDASGDMIVIRYADDTIVGFQHEHEARAFLDDQ